MSTPRISIILPFYNAERFFAEALQSVIDQTYVDWELLLIDDGSTDRSTAIAHELEQRDSRVRYLEHAGHANKGQAATRNVGIREARGDYLAMLDADDIWLPEKLKEQVSILDRHVEVAMVYGPLLFWFGWTGEPEDAKRDFLCPMGDRYNCVTEPPTMLLRQIRHTDGLPGTCSLLLRRSVALEVGLFEERFGMYEDEVFLSKVALRHPVYVMDRALDRYRQHPGSFSAKAIARGEYAWSKGPPNWSRAAFLRWLMNHVKESGLHTEVLLPAIASQLEPFEKVGR